MAQKIRIVVAGGQEITKNDIRTVREAKMAVDAAGYTAVVNGNPAGDEQELSDYAFVALSKPVKAGK